MNVLSNATIKQETQLLFDRQNMSSIKIVTYQMNVLIKKFINTIPVPWQYLHLFFSCCSTLLASINIRAEMTPTAPPEKDATMGSTWLI